MTTTIERMFACNWCGQRHAQPAQNALEALQGCCRPNNEAERARENLYEAELHGAPEGRLAVLRARVRQALAA